MASAGVRWGLVAVLAAVAVAVWVRGGISSARRAAGDPASLGLPATMRAVRLHAYGGPGVMVLEDVPSPGVLGDSEVVVRVDYAGVNPIDWKLRRGNLQAIMSPPLPLTLGFDFAGTVVAAGPAVTKLTPGARVFGRQPVIDRGGSYADFVVVGEDDAVRTPHGVSQAHAACMGVAGLTAWQAVATLGRVTARPRGASVLVVGASGGVGSIVVQVAAKLGARVTAVCSGHNADFVKHLGAAEVVDYTKTSTEDMFLQATRPFDVVIDCVGGDDLWELASQHMSYNDPAYVTIVGPTKHGGSDAVTIVDMVSTGIHVAARKLHATLVGGPSYDIVLGLSNQQLPAVADMLGSGDITAQIGYRFPLDQAASAHELSETHHTRGKIVLKVHEDADADVHGDSDSSSANVDDAGQV